MKSRDTNAAIVDAFVEILLRRRGIPLAEQPLIGKWMREAILAWQQRDDSIVDPHGPLAKELLDGLENEDDASDPSPRN